MSSLCSYTLGFVNAWVAVMRTKVFLSCIVFICRSLVHAPSTVRLSHESFRLQFTLFVSINILYYAHITCILFTALSHKLHTLYLFSITNRIQIKRWVYVASLACACHFPNSAFITHVACRVINKVDDKSNEGSKRNQSIPKGRMKKRGAVLPTKLNFNFSCWTSQVIVH